MVGDLPEPLAVPGQDLPEAFYVPTAEGFAATWATESPWDTSAQHGGPPSALLGHVLRTLDPRPELRIARLTVEFLGTVPRAELRADARIVRPGKRIRLLEASLSASGRTVALARAWEIARTDPGSAGAATASVPGPQEQRYFEGFTRWGYGEAIEWRWTRGSLTELGPAAVWARPRIPLLPGEPTHPLDSVLLVADSANGISATLPLGDWLFVPPAATVTVHRHPIDEWVHVDARTSLSGDGIGSTYAALADRHGPLGSITQPLLVTRR